MQREPGRVRGQHGARSLDLDLGRGVEIPGHFDGPVGLDLVLDQDLPTVQHGDPAPGLAHMRCVRLGQIGNGQCPLRVGMERDQARACPGVLVLAVDRQGIVALGAQAVVTPAILAEVARQVVFVASQVERPALALVVKDERPQVEVAVIGLVVSPLETDKERILVVPGGAEERDIDTPEDPGQRLLAAGR